MENSRTHHEHVIGTRLQSKTKFTCKSHVRRRRIHRQFHTGYLSHRGVLLAQGVRHGREGPRGATRVTVTALSCHVWWCGLVSILFFSESLCFCVKQLGRHSQTLGGSRRLMVSKSGTETGISCKPFREHTRAFHVRGAPRAPAAPRLKLSV